MSQIDNGLDPTTNIMTSKRNSRAFQDEAAHRGEGQQKHTPYRSRRNSRSSSREDTAVNSLDGEESSSSSSTKDSSGISRNQSASTLGKDASGIVAATMSQAKGTHDTHPHRPLNMKIIILFQEQSANLLKAELASVVAPTIALKTDLAAPPLDGRPHNFGVVAPGVYRSSYPKPEHFKFIQDLKLKTVV